MTKCAIICGLVFAFGCGKGGMDGKLDDLAKIRDKMCQCADKKCADDTRDEFVAWKKGNKKDDRSSKDQDERFQSIKKEMMDCRHKLAGAGDDSGGGTGGGHGHEGMGSGSADGSAPAAGSGSGS
jgi:hypothetical protein